MRLMDMMMRFADYLWCVILRCFRRKGIVSRADEHCLQLKKGVRFRIDGGAVYLLPDEEQGEAADGSRNRRL